MSTMLKGAKKAVVRAPHRLIGSKSVEDRIIIEWTKDFTTADAAFDLIIAESKNLIQSWKNLLKSQRAMIDTLSELYAPIREENLYRAVQETPESATRAVQDLQTKLIEISAQIEPIVEELEVSVVERCKQVKKYIDGVQKALTKREHKKIDFDRFSNSVEKQAKKTGLTEKEHAHLAKSETELDAALDLFQAQDEKVKTYIPFVLNTLSEFLNYLSTVLYLCQHKATGILKSQLIEYATAQGLLSGKLPTDYIEIVEEWESRFITIQPQCEEGIKSIKEGKTVGTPMTMPSRKRDKAKNLVNQTGDMAHKAFLRVKHPSVSHIQFSSPSQGMFRSEADILNSPGSPGLGIQRPSSRGSPASTGSSTIGGSGLRSPITADKLDDTSTIDAHTLTRARALSSSSAQALSPESIRTSQNKVLIPPKSENDEYATALFTFAGNEPGDVAFRMGDKIRVLDHGDEVDQNWWFGETSDGRVGLFPCNYVSSPVQNNGSLMA